MMKLVSEHTAMSSCGRTYDPEKDQDLGMADAIEGKGCGTNNREIKF